MANYKAIKYDLPAAANFSGVSVSNLSVSEAAVTAHQSALTITESQISDLSHTSTGNFSLSNNTISTNNGDDGIDLSISGATSDDPPALVMRKWRFSNDGTINFADPFTGATLTDGTISTTKIGQWDDAYGWGNHASAGYLTSVSGDITVDSIKIDDGVQEKYSALTGATGTVTHDCDTGHIFSHSSISANFTANITNLNCDSSYATTVTLVLNQGGTAYMPTAVQIAGSAQTITWQGGSAPSGTSSGIDVVSFSILNAAGTYTVLGSSVSYS